MGSSRTLKLFKCSVDRVVENLLRERALTLVPLLGSQDFDSDDRTAPRQDGSPFLELLVFCNDNEHCFLDGILCRRIIPEQYPRIGHEFFPALERGTQNAITPLLVGRVWWYLARTIQRPISRWVANC